MAPSTFILNVGLITKTHLQIHLQMLLIVTSASSFSRFAQKKWYILQSFSCSFYRYQSRLLILVIWSLRAITIQKLDSSSSQILIFFSPQFLDLGNESMLFELAISRAFK